MEYYSYEKSVPYLDVSPLPSAILKNDEHFNIFSDENDFYSSPKTEPLNNENISNNISNSKIEILENKKEILEILENEKENEKIQEKSNSEEIQNDFFDFPNVIDIGKKNLLFSEDNILNLEEEEKENKSTQDISKKKNKVKINKCIFGLKSNRKIEPRIDYAIKNNKVFIIKYLKEETNKLIKKCGFKNKLKKLKLFSPSYKYFTGNSNEKENKIFLNFTVEQIFTYPEGIITKNDNRLQRKNKDIIKKFKEYNDEHSDGNEHLEKLINFLNMTFREVIVLFYESNYFKEFCSSSKTVFLDKQFVKGKGFSLMEKNAFFKLIKKDVKV